MHTPRTATLIALTALSVAAINLFLPSLPAMAETFGVSYARVSLSLSGFLAVTALLQLVLGPLSDRYGRRPVILVALAVFCAGSVGAALTSNINVFLFCRVLQGGIIAGSTISRAIVRDIHAPQDAAATLATIGSVMALAPMLGPIIGGGLEALFGWRSNFWAFTGLGLACLLWCLRDLTETHHTRHSNIWAQMQAYPDLLRNRVFWGYTICLSCSTGVFFAFLAGAPLVAAGRYGLAPQEIGFALAATPFGFMIGNLITSRTARNMPLALVMTYGRWITVLGLSALLGLMMIGPVGPVVFFGAMFFIGLGNGFSLPSGTAGVMSVRADLAGSAAGLSGAMIVGFGAALSWVVTMRLGGPTPEVTLTILLVLTALVGLAAALFTLRHETLEIKPRRP